MTELTQARLKELLHYDEDTGVFIWLIATGRRVKVGVVAGSFDKTVCYISIKVDCKKYKAHRLAFLYMEGKIPEVVDHRDGDRTNNSFINLRAATGSGNQTNANARSDNTSGVKGVCWDTASGKWLVRLGIDGKCKNLGYFSTIEEATKVVREARELHHGEFANHG